LRVAWPDWWSDGFGSSARETAAARHTQAGLVANQGLLSMAKLLGASLSPDLPRRLDKIESALLFWDEHTMGAAESISDPLSENSMVQWAEKAAYVWEAAKENRLLQEAAMGLIQGYIPKTDTATMAVFNTLGRPRSGLVEVYIDHEILPPGRDFKLVDPKGEDLAAQPSRSRADGTYWYVWVNDVPSWGYRLLRIERLKTTRPDLKPLKGNDPLLENAYYRILIDPGTGGITSLLDKEWGRDLVDSGNVWQMGQLIHERISNRAQLERFRLVDQERTGLSDVSVERGVDGPLWKSLLVSGNTEAALPGTRLRCEIRLFQTTKRVDLLYSLVKKDTAAPEALYVAFPFRIDPGRILYEAQGGMVSPGENQLEGTSSDWHALQNYCLVKGSGGQIILSSPEVPLVQFGGLNLGRFRYIAQVEEPVVYSWVMNNYWVTNFRASQPGEFSWSYALTSAAEENKSQAAGFGWGVRIPLLTRVFPPSFQKAASDPVSLLEIEEQDVLLVASRPLLSGKSIIIQVRETGGRETEFSVRSPYAGGEFFRLRETNVLGDPIGPVTVRPGLNAFETKFYRLLFKP
jgi:alpha-mannosidase